MRNRARCKLCGEIIESFHSTDYMMCKCGEIAVDCGNGMKCFARDFDNFLRIDDEGNEIVPKVIENTSDVKPLDKDAKKPSRADLMQMLSDMTKTIESLPREALNTYVTHYDLLSALLLLSAILRSERD